MLPLALDASGCFDAEMLSPCCTCPALCVAGWAGSWDAGASVAALDMKHRWQLLQFGGACNANLAKGRTDGHGMDKQVFQSAMGYDAPSWHLQEAVRCAGAAAAECVQRGGTGDEAGSGCLEVRLMARQTSEK